MSRSFLEHNDAGFKQILEIARARLTALGGQGKISMSLDSVRNSYRMAVQAERQMLYGEGDVQKLVLSDDYIILTAMLHRSLFHCDKITSVLHRMLASEEGQDAAKTAQDIYEMAYFPVSFYLPSQHVTVQ